ncbi:EAL domain-containing protein [Magnetovibrio sp. PR-2]|uniref:EAL domain-containing protein n=1 Tax=Magnetovibrio sp. PR-2 TaxID=3120356 RepID=UPI002FCE31B9
MATQSGSASSHMHRRTQEQLLLEYLRRLENRREGRKAVRINLSALMPANRREHHVRAATNSFEGLVSELAGQLFELKNMDLFFIYKGEVNTRVQDTVQKVKFLFSDDPLFDEKDRSDSAFINWFDVETGYDDLIKMVREMSDEGAEEKRPSTRSNVRASLKARQDHGDALSPEILGRAVKALQRTDLTSLVRRQFVCGVSKKLVPEPIFSELYISIMDLRETMMPGINLTSNRWLFQYLTESLDRRILSLLSKTDRFSITGDISFNVNVSTLMSQDFIAFDDGISAARRGSMVLELQKIDIFADLGAFLFVREYCQEKGYRICLDGLTHQNMSMINRERLGVDYFKVMWNSELIDGGSAMRKQMRDMVQEAGRTRVILARCDNREAVDFGRSVGINMFQGHYVEHLIAEDERRRQLLKIKHRIERDTTT